MPVSDFSVDVVVSGPRDHFNTVRAINSLGALRYLVTDLYIGRGSNLAFTKPVLKRLSRFKLPAKIMCRDAGLSNEQVHAANFSGLINRWERRKASNADEARRVHLKQADRLAKAAVRKCRPAPDVIVGYRMSDELFKAFEGRSTRVLCQNDGGSHEVHVVREEARRFSEWVPDAERKTLFDTNNIDNWLGLESERLKSEWELSDRIVCWSEWCKTCIVKEGVTPDKCVIIPPSFSPSTEFLDISHNFHRKQFVIGFLGTLCIRKGTHRLLDAALAVSRIHNIKVSLAGVNNLNADMLSKYSGVTDHLGVVPHIKLKSFLQNLDVLALPSISEGFGIVQLEAMSAGVPVITTDRCGEVVQHNTDGLLIPSHNTEALAEAISLLADNRRKCEEMSQAARERALQFSLEATAEKWKDVITSVIKSQVSLQCS